MPDNTTRESIGGRLQAERKARGLTQDQLGKMFDVSKQAVSAWENGHSAMSPNLLDQIAQRLDISTMWLITGEGKKQRSNPSTTGSLSRHLPSADEMADAIGPGRFEHLVQAGASWDYILTDPNTGLVRMAVQFRFMVAPDPVEAALSSSPSSPAEAPAPAQAPPAA